MLLCVVQQFHPGEIVGLGKDYTIYAKADGLVHFQEKRGRKYISVKPMPEYTPPAEGMAPQRTVQVNPRHHGGVAALWAGSSCCGCSDGGGCCPSFVAERVLTVAWCCVLCAVTGTRRARKYAMYPPRAQVRAAAEESSAR